MSAASLEDKPGMTRYIVWTIAALLAVLAVVAGRHFVTLVRVGAGYTAKQMCSCLYVSQRNEAACHGELEAPADKLVSWTAKEGEVRASTLGLSHATARYEPGFGCVLED